MYGYKPLRILFNTGCFFGKDEVDNWIKFVNTRTNNKGQLPDGCVLIACVQANSSRNFMEEQFSGKCDTVCLKPFLDKWSRWMSSRCNQEIEQQQPQEELHDGVFHAGWAPETKTVLQEDGSVWWSSGDEISLFVGEGNNGGYKLTSTNNEPYFTLLIRDTSQF